MNAITLRNEKQLSKPQSKLKEVMREQVEFCPTNTPLTNDKENKEQAKNTTNTSVKASPSMSQLEALIPPKKYVPPLPYVPLVPLSRHL